MINFHQELVSALSEVLPTHYEMTLTSGTPTPCISYMELNNYQSTESDDGSTIGYSRIIYQIKVWANSIAEIQDYAVQVDRKIRPLGFKRTSSGELYDNQSTMIQKVMNYECLALEQY